MAGKKKSFKFMFDSPVTVSFALLSTVLFLLMKFVFKDKIDFACHGKDLFDPKKIMEYIRLFSHPFSYISWNQFFINLTFVLMLGPVLEERYGSPVLSLMMVTSTIVSGVLNVCFSPVILSGATGIVFTMILLANLSELKKKQLKISWLLIFILFSCFEIYLCGSIKNTVPVLIHFAGGLCGSLFGFLVMPKKREPKQKAEKTIVRSEYKPASDDDATVIGSINLD